MSSKERLFEAIRKRKKKKFFKELSKILYKKPFPDFAIEWATTLRKEAKKQDKVLVLEAPRNHLKSTAVTIFDTIWDSLTNPFGYHTMIFSYSMGQAKWFVGIIKKIFEYLFPDVIDKDIWSRTTLGLKNGAIIEAASMSGTYYGRHPNKIILDDPLGGEGDPSRVVKSNLPPGFIEERFFSMIFPMRSKETEIIVVGIPFFIGDLFTKLEQKPDAFYVRKFPAIREDGSVLWPKERPYEWLMKQKKAMGSLRFAREYLLKPFDSSTSLFPSRMLIQSLDKNIPLTKTRLNKDSICVVGADFSISANIGSDYCVFTALEFVGGKIYITDWLRFRDADYTSQLERLKRFAMSRQADLVAVETTSFQRIYAQEARKMLLPIYEHSTHTEKNWIDRGVPSLVIYFEKGQVVLPYGDERAKELSEIFMKEMEGFTIVNGKVVHLGEHDDMGMSFYIGIQGLRSLVTLDDEIDYSGDKPFFDKGDITDGKFWDQL